VGYASVRIRIFFLQDPDPKLLFWIRNKSSIEIVFFTKILSYFYPDPELSENLENSDPNPIRKKSSGIRHTALRTRSAAAAAACSAERDSQRVRRSVSADETA